MPTLMIDDRQMMVAVLISVHIKWANIFQGHWGENIVKLGVTDKKTTTGFCLKFIKGKFYVAKNYRAV